LTAGTDTECQRKSITWDGQDGEFICTSNGRGRGTCRGDGGGPLVLPNSTGSDENFAGYLVGIDSFNINVSDSKSEECAYGNLVLGYFTRVAKHVDWIAGVMGVNSSELLAAPDDDEADWGSDGGVFRFPNSAVSFPMKRSFDDILRLMALCSLALAIIAFNN
jgi:secreted trypsin-like serine protease